MRIALTLALALFISTPVLAQDGEKKMGDKPMGASDSDKKMTRKEKKAAKEAADKVSAETSKATAAIVKKISFTAIAEPGDKKTLVANARTKLNQESAALKLDGKSAKAYREAGLELVKKSHEIQANAHQRRDEVLRLIAVELSSLTKKRAKDVDVSLYKLYYGATQMRPDQYRELRKDREEKDNAFTLLILETGKSLETVRDSVTKTRTAIAAENPFTYYQRIVRERSAFAGKLKNLFTPEQYFAYLEMKGIDKAPKKRKGVDGKFNKVLKDLKLTRDQTRRIRAISRNKKMDRFVKREKIEEILTKEQRKDLAKALGETPKAKKKDPNRLPEGDRDAKKNDKEMK